jgi:hypothetical protein
MDLTGLLFAAHNNPPRVHPRRKRLSIQLFWGFAEQPSQNRTETQAEGQRLPEVTPGYAHRHEWIRYKQHRSPTRQEKSNCYGFFETFCAKHKGEREHTRYVEQCSKHLQREDPWIACNISPQRVQEAAICWPSAIVLAQDGIFHAM